MNAFWNLLAWRFFNGKYFFRGLSCGPALKGNGEPATLPPKTLLIGTNTAEHPFLGTKGVPEGSFCVSVENILKSQKV